MKRGAPGPRTLLMLATAPALLLLAFQATAAWPFFSDDSFISLRYADRLLAGDGLTWTDGADGAPEYVEGYSNLSWVLLVAGLGWLGMPLVDAARLLGALCTIAALLLLARAQRPHDLRTAALAAIAPLLVAAAQPVSVWTLGGLEGPLVLLLLAWGLGGVVRQTFAAPDALRWSRARLCWLGVPFALLCWTRPDGPLWAFTAGVGVGAIAATTGGRRLGAAVARAFWFGVPALVAVAAQLGFRVLRYGDVVPNTAHVKAGFEPSQFGAGLDYVCAAVRAMPGVFALAALGAVLLLWRARPRALVLVLLLPTLGWLGYLCAIGGDHFPGFRLLHGLLAPLALLAALGLRSIGRGALPATIAVLVALGAAATDTWRARHHPGTAEARSEVWEWHGRALGEALRDAFAARPENERPLLAVEAAGALPFYSELPTLDLLGLCDRTIATTPFPPWLDTVRPGTPRPPGHLRGNGDYAIARQPDLMLFAPPPGLPVPVYVSGCEFEDDPRFLEHYRCVLLDLDRPEILPGRREPHIAPLWVRVEGRAGVQRHGAHVTVPAWLFGSYELRHPVQLRYQVQDRPTAAAQQAEIARMLGFLQQRAVLATPADSGAIVLRLAPAARATFSLQLAAGTWQAAIEPTDATPVTSGQAGGADPGGNAGGDPGGSDPGGSDPGGNAGSNPRADPGGNANRAPSAVIAFVPEDQNGSNPTERKLSEPGQVTLQLTAGPNGAHVHHIVLHRHHP